MSFFSKGVLQLANVGKSTFGQMVRQAPHVSFGTQYLTFADNFGNKPSEGAINLWKGKYTKKAVEISVMAAVALNKSASQNLKKSLDTLFSSICENSGDDGHVYCVTVNVPLTKELAPAVMGDPRSLLQLMLCFPVKIVFMKVETADKLLNLTADERITHLMRSDVNAQIIKEDAEIRTSDSMIKLYDIAMLFNNVDLVYFHDYQDTADAIVGGVRSVSIKAGTTLAHGLNGVLQWELIHDPANPANIIIRFFGEGKSPHRHADWFNNAFAGYGFPVMGELFQYKVMHGQQQLSYKDFDNYVKNNNLKLWNRWSMISFTLAQRINEFVNEILDNLGHFPRDFDAAKHLQELKQAKALVVRESAELLVVDINDKRPITEVLAEKAKEEAGLQPGVVANDGRVESDLKEVVFVDEPVAPKEVK